MMRARRDEAEFTAFVERFGPTLLRAAYLMVRDRGIAEDVAQTTLERTLRRWSSARQAPEPYSRQVLVNVCRDHWRSRRRHPEELLGEDDGTLGRAVGETECDGAVDRLTLDELLQTLAPPQRAVLVLRFYLGLSIAETARLLSMREGTVKSTTHRALDRLRESLDDHPQEVSSHADR